MDHLVISNQNSLEASTLIYSPIFLETLLEPELLMLTSGIPITLVKENQANVYNLEKIFTFVEMLSKLYP